ncbi:cell morphogenesis protein-like protein PAG1 [Mollisia scopiformis]|uniref:Cell morphogenesis protein-like protein PAG1 n=1 Tax=Mollisia scopiformis TaxID=149040 RepID=A0A132B3I9_MOLSC|nr:cell morphogenesis protein-like protein PAG1 [Mollisia scopiformis]KUJ06950.1 cell morphogenesis protein-like protein PAG1 [Mollisia scopiformis]
MSQSPDSLSERLGFSPVDFDVWSLNHSNTSTPTFARFGPDAKDIPATQTSASQSRDLQAQPSKLSPRLLGGNRLNESSKAHNRQTSIVHGFTHSRNGSASSSPLSPQMLMAAGGSDASSMGDTAFTPNLGLNNGASSTSSSTTLPERTSSAADANNLTQRRVERNHSGKSSRDHRHHHSHSRHHHKEELKTVGEYALHVLFTSFIAQAEEKISQCITIPLDPEPQIEQICGPGVDPTFDQLISALGHIASQKPKPLIDSMMLWRKNKSDAANEARIQLQQSRGNALPGPMLRRNTEPIHILPEDALAANSSPSIAARQEFVAQAERRSTASIYILCRVLMEVIGQSTLKCITPEMEEKLEGIIFGQLKIADADQLNNSPLKMANWFLFSQLLGTMSEINFESVADRFITDLEKSQRDLVVKSPVNRETEGRMELVLGGMKHLRIKIYPEDAWDHACDFMISLGRFFARSHGHRLKYAYCQALEILLLPIAAKANTELNLPKWTEVLGTIGPRLASMFVKPRHWAIAFPLTATLLCVSPVETFSTQWLQLILPLQPKFKDRFARSVCLQVISRLLWTYLYRTSDTQAATIKKLEEVLKLVLPPGRRTYLSTEPTIADPLIQIIRIIGYKNQDFCFRTIVFPLINADLFTSGKELKVEQLEPERMVIGIRAFLAIMSDLEKGEQGRPPFPQHYQALPFYDRMPTSPIMTAPRSPPLPPEVRSSEDRLSRPVLTTSLSEVGREYYAKFCEILGKITIICDNTFGGQAVLDEKFNSPAPKTPLAESFNFARRDDHQSPNDQKQGFYELLHVAVQALPRCLSADIPFNSLVNLLCTGTAHVQYTIAESSAQSLKSIARQSHAQQVTIGFARFIFNFDDRYSTMSDGGMLGAGHIESTLKLYVELLQIWISEIKQRTKDAAADSSEDGSPDKRSMQLDLSAIWAHVDEVESHGLFFLCSQSRRVRAFAITVLRLITEFDTALGKDNGRLIHILEGDSMRVMDFNDEHLSVAERSRLQRGMRKSNSQSALIELCSSEVSYDTTLWFKIFPNLIRISYERCPFAVTLGRELICNRILQMYKVIVALSEPIRGPPYGSFDRFETGSGRLLSRSSTTPPEVVIEQWKLYLIVACTTLSDKGGQQPQSPQAAQHLRKGSKQSQTQEKITSARSLFKYILPLLSAGPASIRDAVVVALGSINVNIYKTLLEELQGAVNKCNDEARARIHQRTTSSPKRNRKFDLLRTEITHVYRLTSSFLKETEVHQDDWILNNLVVYTKDLKLFLMDDEVQMDWEFQKLRRHYCGLMEELFEGINRTKDPSRWMTFESRKSSFALMEDWCGFSPNQNQIRVREDNMRQSMIDQQTLASERGTVTAAMEIEKRNLRTAALSAMAALCGGPVSITTESRATLQFDIRRMLSWIDTIFNSGSDRMHVIGRRALKNLIVHNKDYPYLLEHSIAKCYMSEQSKVLESYFSVVTDVLIEHPDYPMPFWKLLCIGLYTLGSEVSGIRSKSAHVLRALEERQQKSSKIQDYDISISDKTKAVYKLAQFEISKRLSKQHSELAFIIFSEMTMYFKEVQASAQRNMVAAILPWVQIVELQLDPNGGPTAQSYVLLANLFEITIKSSSHLHNEVQALWQALATGPHAGNVQLVLDFIMSLCLDRREQNFVEFAKQIVVFLSSTPAGVKVVEFLLMQITPKAMIPNEKRELIPPPPDTGKLPYLAELSEALPIGAKQAGFSLGQLSLILLVDLMVSPVQLVAENVPLLLQVVTVLWDHYIPLVQEQAREMLIHLIHELVISKIDDDQSATKKSIEDFIESVRSHDPKVIWAYEDNNGKVDDQDNKVPAGMELLSTEVVKKFEITYPGIQEQWAKLSLTWATSCPVRHLACRSFQIFRCILTSLDQPMLADMLARLSNTIADEDPDVQTFSMEILTTLKTLICKLDPGDLINFPQLFWTTCACLDTINEREFLEALGMLEELLQKLNLNDISVRLLLTEGRPPRWDGPFEGLQPLVHKGLRSSVCFESTRKVLDKLVQLPNDELIGDDSRLLFAVLANFPRLLHAMDQDLIDAESIKSAEILATIAELQGYSSISRALGGFAASRYRSSKDFLAQLVSALREAFFPQWEFGSLTFLMGLLTNSIPWVKVKTMRILCSIIPDIDMQKQEIASHGPDLISPLLRLLQTEFCMQALEVLDQIMTMTGTSMDKHHLRMSMTKSSSKAIRKEYERTQSLFGIPEESGWSIPVPAKHAETTRANVHAAFYMCQNSENMDPETARTPEVEFHVDDFQYGYFPVPERTETMMSDEGRGDGNIGDLMMKLDSLDDFFEDSLQSPTSDGRSSRTITEAGFASEGFESGAQLYDEQTLPILHQSLARTSSVASFQNGFADMRSSTAMSTQQPAMNPGAFSIGPTSRPGMHSRSVTSPSAPASSSSQTTLVPLTSYTSDDDYTEEVFSDGDEDRVAASGEGSFFLENMIKPLAQGTRSGMRRLTGGRSRDNERMRDNLRVERRGLSQPPKSPRVPKVPREYLGKTTSPGASSSLGDV